MTKLEAIMEIDSLTTNIAKEIVKECKIIGTKVEENFAYHFVIITDILSGYQNIGAFCR